MTENQRIINNRLIEYYRKPIFDKLIRPQYDKDRDGDEYVKYSAPKAPHLYVQISIKGVNFKVRLFDNKEETRFERIGPQLGPILEVMESYIG